MSRIDKLVTKAFPDELRNVEPTAVDEDAILSRTLEKLGLEKQAEPQPVKKPVHVFHQAPEAAREDKLIEIPLEEVKPHWVNRILLGIAACLLLAVVVNWGPWLLNSLGFGARVKPLSPGELESSGADASQAIADSPDVMPVPDTAPAQDGGSMILKGDAGNIRVTEFSCEGSSLTVYMRFDNKNNAGAPFYTITAQCREKELYCISRTTGDATGLITLDYMSEQAGLEDDTITLLVTLVPGLVPEESMNSDPLTAAGFYLHPRTDSVSAFTPEDYAALGYTEDRRTGLDDSGN